MHIYRKKPIEISAIIYTGTPSNITKLTHFLGVDDLSINADGLVIPTLEGNMLASLGDYIIKGIAGEFYPCKPSIFNASYTRVM